jgi:hypothetical protein
MIRFMAMSATHSDDGKQWGCEVTSGIPVDSSVAMYLLLTADPKSQIGRWWLKVKKEWEEIYMRQPEGYHTGGPNMVFRLRKSLYGLKQAARQWNKKLRSVLEGIGYSRLCSNNSIYIYSKGDIKVIVLVFIDDITLVSKSESAMASAVTELSKHFKLRDLGSTTLLLGIQVKQDCSNGSIPLSQEHYIRELLEHFNMDDANPLSTPLSPGSVLSDIVPSLEEQAKMKSVPYLNAVGALQYLATMTRPDIAYAVSYLRRFNCNPAPAQSSPS